jgi:hemolysin III
MENVMRRTGGFPKRYTLGEEVMNAVTHGLGTILAVAGATLLIASSALQGDPYKLGSSIVYGVSLTLLYLMSTVYHGVASSRAKEILRIFDHCSIFLLIAGTYTPFALVTLREHRGWLLFGAIWAAAVVGITLNAISLRRFEKLSLACYVAMGWAVVFQAGTLAAALSPAGLVLLVAGGICYTGGILFYKLRRPYMHGVWHLFVLAGSVCHFLCVLFDVIG